MPALAEPAPPTSQLLHHRDCESASTLRKASAKPKRAQWKSGALLTTLLIAPLSLAAVANAQTIIGPGTITSTQTVTAGNSPATVVGNTTINVPGSDGIDAPPFNGSGGTLNINTEAAPTAVPGRGPISIISGGTGVASIFPSSLATVSINAGPSGNVTITSGGAALGLSGNASLTANANGSELLLHSTGNYGVVAQFGASVNITGASIQSDANGVAGVLIGGDLTNQGATGNFTNVSILTTGSNEYGLVGTRTNTVATMSGGSHGNGCRRWWPLL